MQIVIKMKNKKKQTLNNKNVSKFLTGIVYKHTYIHTQYIGIQYIQYIYLIYSFEATLFCSLNLNYFKRVLLILDSRNIRFSHYISKI